MKKLVTVTLSFFLFAAMTFADGRKDANTRSAEPAKPEAAKKNSDPTVASFEAELEELRHKLESQQEELQLLREQLAKRDRQVEGAREAEGAASARGGPSSNEAAANASPTAAVKAIETSPSASNPQPNSAAPKATPANAADETPASIRYKGVTITPGAFLAAEAVFRTRAAIADVNTPFNSIPYPGNSQSKVSEWNASGRSSRWSLLVEGKVNNVALTGYYEADFLSAATTSNNNQSNSYSFRQRQAFGQAALSSGWTFTGGQMWSLVTETKNGMQNRTEAVPMVIDHQYNVGFSWARQYGFRVVKMFGDQFGLGFSIEGPQTTFGGRGFSTGPSGTNFFLAGAGVPGGLYNPLTNYSFNKTPDFIVKAVFQPGWGHYEIFGVISNFRTRVFPCAVVSTVLPCSINGSTAPSTAGAFNDTRTGGGVGLNIRVPVVAKKVDAGVHFLVGDGIGRYGTAGLSDATARPNGTLALIQAGQALGTLEWHPNPKVDLYANFGGEYARRTAYTSYITVTSTGTTTTNGFGGYGSPLFNNSGCSTEILPANQNAPGTGGACAGDTKNILEGTIGFWHRFYQGPIGKVQWGLQYSYITKVGWSGNNNTPAIRGIGPKAVDNMVLSSFRYYIP